MRGWGGCGKTLDVEIDARPGNPTKQSKIMKSIKPGVIWLARQDQHLKGVGRPAKYVHQPRQVVISVRKRCM